MAIQARRTDIPGVLILEPDTRGDGRGWFRETYSARDFAALGILDEFVQDNHSYSAKAGTLRGLHFQLEPSAQAKLIRCARGRVRNLAVDLRRGSPSYRRWFATELSAENGRMLYLPAGLANGFVSLCDDTELLYKVSAYYEPALDRSVRWDDPAIGADWLGGADLGAGTGMVPPGGFILSDKDRNAPLLDRSDANFSIRALVTGSGGRLGRAVLERLAALGIRAAGMARADADLRDTKAVKAFILNARPDLVVHCAAYTDVDGAESDRETCRAVNVEGTRAVAEAAATLDAAMAYISTDYVFPGRGREPYAEDDQPEPLNWYGATKLEGERVVRSLVPRHFIARTSWLYGGGRDFPRAILDAAKAGRALRVVDDQLGAPSYAPDVARALCDLAQMDRYGSYHIVNEGFCSRYELARELCSLAGLAVPVEPVGSAGYPGAARRPLNSRLASSALAAAGVAPLPGWKEALARYMEKLRAGGEL